MNGQLADAVKALEEEKDFQKYVFLRDDYRNLLQHKEICTSSDSKTILLLYNEDNEVGDL